MEANKILEASLLDIIFEGKNKSYGAYDLRKTYNSRIIKALAFTGLLIISCIGFSSFAGKKNITIPPEIIDIRTGYVDEDPIPPEVIPPKPEVVKAVVSASKQQVLVPPVIVPDKDVSINSRIETLQESIAIGNAEVKIGSEVKIVQAPIIDTGSSVGKIAVGESAPANGFEKVEKEAEFPGGNAAWRKFLQNNLDARKPVNEGAAPGSYTVIIEFIVSAEGNVSEVKALSNLGFGMEKEAVQAISKGPKWIPALQNGKYVKAFRKQPITFLVQD